MFDYLLAIILGVIQGLTEFLPISSSGHLELAKYFFGDDSLPSESLLMTVTLHGATALSTVVVFRKDIAWLFRSISSTEWNDGKRFAWWIVLSMIPAALIGIFFNDALEMLFDKQIFLVACMLLVTGALLWYADNRTGMTEHMSPLKAMVTGLSQAVAILPGISRSGATIATALLLGVERERAARFSFLMVLPLIFGKMTMDVIDGAFLEEGVNLGPLMAGFVAAFGTGWLACTWMISIVKESKLKYFSIYCFVVGGAVILWYYLWH